MNMTGNFFHYQSGKKNQNQNPNKEYVSFQPTFIDVLSTMSKSFKLIS